MRGGPRCSTPCTPKVATRWQRCWTARFHVCYVYNTRRRLAMRNWTMAILPLAFAMTATGCSGADKDAARQDGGRDGPPAHVGPIATQDSALPGFTGVEVTGPDDLAIRRGAAFPISHHGRPEPPERPRTGERRVGK